MALTLSQKDCIKLGKTLPSRLITFFRKYPTATLYGLDNPTSIKSADAISNSPTISKESSDGSPENTMRSTQPVPEFHNPFMPMKNHVTGRWRGARYGLRIQADLVKLAAANGVEDFLPYTKKKTGERQRRREEHGLRIKGTGVGQRVKGKKWERTLRTRLTRRKNAMLRMPSLIYHWKRVSVDSYNFLRPANIANSLGMAGDGNFGQSKKSRHFRKDNLMGDANPFLFVSLYLPAIHIFILVNMVRFSLSNIVYKCLISSNRSIITSSFNLP